MLNRRATPAGRGCSKREIRLQCEQFLFVAESIVRLSDLPKGTAAVVDRVDDAHADDPIAQRLRDLGFVEGESVRVAAVAPMGGDPLLIQIGFTRFALRRAEAARVAVRSEVAA
jgi:ferrous iron transport protein A